jgi:hypothetical protein
VGFLLGSRTEKIIAADAWYHWFSMGNRWKSFKTKREQLLFLRTAGLARF